MVTRAVSTWSLHRTLGRFTGPDSKFGGGSVSDAVPAPDALPLLALPAELKRHGYETVQICHFHLPSRSPTYLGELRAALDESDIVLDAILIDDGDLTSATAADGAEAWIGEWLDTATALGARRARVCAGRSTPTAGRLRQSADRLGRLAASHPEVRMVTEDWMELLPDADSVLTLLAATGDTIGLMIDLGNWSGPGKYGELARIAPFAETCHAKCRFAGGDPDREDFSASLQILKDAGYDGPLALIYDGDDDDEWTALDTEFEIVRSVFG
ncbi:MAG: TIM barrel protein [Chloroflexia bacterium]|nr:TIM barrel protein [Chloroflexia bacterium]